MSLPGSRNGPRGTQQAGDTQPRHSRQGHRGAVASLVGGTGKPALKRLLCFGTAWASASPGAEKVQLLQAGTRCKECSQKLQVKVFCVGNCQGRVKCFSCSLAAKSS